MSTLDEIRVVTNASKESLNQRQILDYRSQREACLRWLLTFGKQPAKAEGYAKQTVKTRANRMDRFYRWVWDRNEGYTANVTHDHADAYLRHLAHQDKSNVHKSNCRKALCMLFKWRHHKHGLDEWEPALSFSTTTSAANPQDRDLTDV